MAYKKYSKIKSELLFLILVIFLIFASGASNAAANTLSIFGENFEAATVGGIPAGWTVENSGSQIAASNATAYDGAKSLFMQGRPYGGANLLKDIPVVTSGKYLISFGMKVNTAAWTGSDGVAVAQFSLNGSHVAGIGVVKVSGVYKVSIRDDAEQISDFPADINSWVRYSIQVDLDANKNLYYINGVLVGSRSLGIGPTYNNRIMLGTGDAGAGGGHPAAYFDSFTIEKIMNTTVQKIVFTKQVATGNTNLWMMNPDGTSQEELTNLQGYEANPKISPDGSKIAFTSNASGAYEVYVMNADGTGIRQLTNGQNSGGQLTWHPSGTKIYYANGIQIYDAAVRSVNVDGTGDTQVFDHAGYHDLEVDAGPDGNHLVYIYESCCWTPNRSIRLRNLSDGSDIEILPSDGYSDFYPRFSPDGNHIIWTKNRTTDPYSFGYDIWRMNKDGSSQTNLTGAYSSLQFFCANYSRDGGKIVVQGVTNGGDGNIYIMNADGSGLQQLTSDSAEEGAPDIGMIQVNTVQKIIFSKKEASGKYDLWMMDPDGSNQQRLTDEAKNGVDSLSPSIFPDGNKILYQRGYNIAILDIATLQTTLVTTDGADGTYAYSEPNLSPDGTKIAYTYGLAVGGSCSACQTWDVWMMNVDGSNKIRMTNNSYRDASPIFSSDGTKLLITHYQGAPSSDCCNATDVYILDIATKAETKLYGSSYYDWGWDWNNSGILFGTQDGALIHINPDGTGSTTLVDASYAVSWATYSPSGDKIAYQSPISGSYNLYVVNADGSNPVQITTGMDVGGYTWGYAGARTSYSSDWQSVTPLQTARDQFAGGVINGKIYVFGGNGDPDGLNLKTTEVFDPANSQWSYLANNEHNNGNGVEELTGAVVNNKLYVFGGWGGGVGIINFVEEYDPATNTWISKAPMPTTRAGAIAVEHNGEIYVFGGELPPDFQMTNVVEVYNPFTNTWRSVANMPFILRMQAISVVGGKAYVIGGYDGTQAVNTVVAYDFLSNTWTTTGFAPLPTPRVFSYAAAAPVIDGKIYLIGGYTGNDASNMESSVVEIYDTATNTWTTGPSLRTPLGDHLSVILAGEIYVVGGDTSHTDDDDTRTNAVWRLNSTSSYDATGTWNYVTSNHTNNCGEPNLTETGTLTITQTGNTFTSIDDEGNSISGTVSGTTYTVTGTYPEDGGTTTETITFTLSSSTAGTGRDDWSWTDGSYSCSGGNDFTITKASSVLNAPTLSSPADGATGQAANVSVTWADTNSSPQESGYKMRIKPSGGSYTEYSMSQNATSYATSGLSAGVTYYWSVKAVGNGTSTLDSSYPADRAFSVGITPATYDATGTWNFVTSNHTNNCGEPNLTETGTLTITQTGNTFTSIDDEGNSISGTVSGATYTVTGTYPEDGGTTTETITFTLSSSTAGTGRDDWSWTDGSYSCSGGNDFTITKAVAVIKGDIDGLNGVTLADAILALKIISGLSPAGIRADYASSGADVNGDGKIGLAEVIYILQKAAEIR